MDQDQNIRFVIILVSLVFTFFFAREFRKFRKMKTTNKTKYLSWLIGVGIVLFITLLLAVFFADDVLSNLEPLYFLLYLIVVLGVGLPMLIWLLKKKKRSEKPNA